jgi:hypothetical protein
MPEIETGIDGFVVSKVTGENKERITGSTKTEQNVSMEDVLREDGEKLESFDFGEDKDR